MLEDVDQFVELYFREMGVAQSEIWNGKVSSKGVDKTQEATFGLNLESVIQHFRFTLQETGVESRDTGRNAVKY